MKKVSILLIALCALSTQVMANKVVHITVHGKKLSETQLPNGTVDVDCESNTLDVCASVNASIDDPERDIPMSGDPVEVEVFSESGDVTSMYEGEYGGETITPSNHILHIDNAIQTL